MANIENIVPDDIPSPTEQAMRDRIGDLEQQLAGKGTEIARLVHYNASLQNEAEELKDLVIEIYIERRNRLYWMEKLSYIKDYLVQEDERFNHYLRTVGMTVDEFKKYWTTPLKIKRLGDGRVMLDEENIVDDPPDGITLWLERQK